jgi:hypothetical protein
LLKDRGTQGGFDMRKVLFAMTAVIVLVLVPAVSRADDKAEAQKKLDEAKIKACEGVKKYLAAQAKACPTQSADAAKIECKAAADFTKVQELNVSCAKQLQDKAGATVKKYEEEKAARDATKDQCKALDDSGAVLAEATDPSVVGCKNKLKEALKAKCTEGVKKFNYQFQRSTNKPSKSMIFCK